MQPAHIIAMLFGLRGNNCRAQGFSPAPVQGAQVFSSFFLAGFECSTHRRPDGVRLDLVTGSGHEAVVLDDYRACVRHGLHAIRDGLRWHLIEQEPGRFEWASWQPMLEAAASTGVEVAWDLCHYGIPDHLRLEDDSFPERFAAFSAAAARVHRAVTGTPLLACPINEISFFTWAINTGYFPRLPVEERGFVKRQLLKAALAAVAAIRSVDPACRFLWAEPLINILPPSPEPAECDRVEQLRLAQFEAYDVLLGHSLPELGGGAHAADVLGFNFYPDNQWIDGGSTIPLGHFQFRPLSDMLVEAHERYGKPIFLSETGAEGSARAAWLNYVCSEVRDAIERGVECAGICLYPVTAFPGWDDLRPAQVGLFDLPDEGGRRALNQPLATELARQQLLFGID